MIPEIGHFALILALLLALVQGVAADRRRGARRSRVDGAGAAGRARTGVLRHLRVAVPAVLVRQQRLLGAQRRAELQLAAAAAVPDRGDLGLARGLAAAVGADAGVWTFAVSMFTPHLPDEMVARVLGVQGLITVRLPAVHAGHLQSVRPPVPGGRRWTRPQPAAAGSRHGDPSADALHGLRRLLGRVRVRARRAARRPARCGLGALVAAVDHARRGAS